MTTPPPVERIEYYVRFVDRKTGQAGIIETAADSAREAASLFAEFDETVSAMKVAIGPNGRAVAMSDATEEVLEALIELVADGRYETCPHPMIADAFEEMEQTAREQEEHIWAERAMLQM
jgi:hypothetical protein